MKMTIKNRIISVSLCVLTFIMMLSVNAAAAGRIETDRDVSLSVKYKDGDKAITGAVFSIYRVADVDAYVSMTVVDRFARYPVNFADMDQDKWNEMALTLKGFVQRDRLLADKEGIIDDNGMFELELKPGLYLVFGTKLTIDNISYESVPFMMFLPCIDETKNEWNYEVTVIPKCTKIPVTSCSVLKIWADAGFESVRPESITVYLLKDGVLFDTQILTTVNNWRYEWIELDPKFEWSVVEEKLDGYYVKTEIDGTKYVITNAYILPIGGDDLPVVKRITGDAPPFDSIFTFVLAAEGTECPMPYGSSSLTKEISIRGSGTGEFGKITFTKAGLYKYRIYEKRTGAEGYSYDDRSYSLTYDIELRDGTLIPHRTITSPDGNKTEYPVFTNRYLRPGNKLPQTGVLWWPVPVLLVAGMAMILLGVFRKMTNNRDE